MDAGFEYTMLEVAVPSEPSSSHEDAMDVSEGIRVRDAHASSARSCSGSAAPVTVGSATARRRVRRQARTESKRRARARHQASPEGRLDHRDREQDRRDREAELYA